MNFQHNALQMQGVFFYMEFLGFLKNSIKITYQHVKQLTDKHYGILIEQSKIQHGGLNKKSLYFINVDIATNHTH